MEAFGCWFLHKSEDSSKIHSEAVEDGDLLKNFRKDFILENGASSAINPNQYICNKVAQLV